MNRARITLLMIAGLAAPAQAAEIDTAQSSITWTGSKVTGDSHTGVVPVKSSKLKVKGGQVVGGGVVMDMAKFTVTDLKGKWADKFIGHMHSKDFFNTKQFPTASLTIKSIKNGTLQGTLTIMGTAQPISFPVKRDGAFYVGKASFDRTKYGIKYGSGSFFKGLGNRMINDQVDVAFRIAVK